MISFYSSIKFVDRSGHSHVADPVLRGLLWFGIMKLKSINRLCCLRLLVHIEVIHTYVSYYKKLARIDDSLQFIVITGKNEKLYEKLKETVEEENAANRTKLLFFVNNVEDYMHVSDLIVTKPGGLTISESLACHLPMAIYNAYPGQEQYNVNFLLKQKAAISVDKKTGAEEIIKLLQSPERLSEMRENCIRLARPKAAEDMYNLARQLDELSKPGDTRP